LLVSKTKRAILLHSLYTSLNSQFNSRFQSVI